MDKLTPLIGRVLLAQLFLMAGLSKIVDYAGTQAYMEAMGVPGGLLPLVIVLEVGASLAMILGWKVAWAAYALAGFSLASAVIFHGNIADQMQMIMMMKNVAIAGGLVMLAHHGAGAYSLDNKKRPVGSSYHDAIQH